MSRLSKVSVLKRGRMLQYRPESNWNYELRSICNSCHKLWCAASQEDMDAFYFTIPGGVRVFVCPICRHMASHVVAAPVSSVMG